MTALESLHSHGTATFASEFDASTLLRITNSLETALNGGPGARGLLREEPVRDAAGMLRRKLSVTGLLRSDAPAVQAIAFNKTPGANWKVAWHQDRQFPFAGRTEDSGCTGWSRKDGADYAEPPRDVLEGLLAGRLHLDRVRPGQRAAARSARLSP